MRDEKYYGNDQYSNIKHPVNFRSMFRCGNGEFEYAIICNKICGAAHYTMRMKVVVESEEDYKQWLSEQTVFYAEKISSQPVEIPAEDAKGIKSELIGEKEHKTTI